MTRRLRFFFLVAAAATVIDFSVYLALQRSFRWWAADVAALVVAAVFGVSAHRKFTLRNDPNLRWIHRPTAFISSIAVAGLVDLTVLFFADSKGWMAKVIAIATAAAVRAVSNRWFLFSVVRAEQSAPANRLQPDSQLRLSVIVPAYREAERIAETIETLHEHLASLLAPETFEIVVVDDGSGDGTAEVAEATGKAIGLLLPENLGKGGAVRMGMLAATGRTRVFLDADLAYGPGEVIRILSEIKSGWDVAVGTRRDSRLDAQTNAGLLRDVGGRMVNIATHVLLLGQYRDTQAGCKGFRGDVADLIFSKTKLNGFSFDIEIFHLVERWRLTLTEVPMTPAATEASTVSLVADTLQLLADIGRIRRWSARGEYTDPERLAMLPDPVLTES